MGVWVLLCEKNKFGDVIILFASVRFFDLTGFAVHKKGGKPVSLYIYTSHRRESSIDDWLRDRL